MTTKVVGKQQLGYFGELYPVKEVIRGNDIPNPYPSYPEGTFDIARSITLCHSDSPSFSRRVSVSNGRDRAFCGIYNEGTPIGVPPVHVTIDEKEQEIPTQNYEGWTIIPGQIFKIWMGEGKEPDPNYGNLEVTYSRPQSEKRYN